MASDPLPSRVLLTGATGFLGSHYLFWRLRAPGRVFALVRGNGQGVAHARGRVLAALEECARAYLLALDHEGIASRLEVLLGDITAPGCGLDPADAARLRDEGVDEVWHCAASLEYQDRFRPTIFEHNVGGTRRVLELARAARAGRFWHVSTAYVAGTLSGTIPEASHAPPSFGNCYEESKHAAEVVVAGFCREHGLDHGILRPAVVVGPSESRRSGGSRFGLYGFVQELHRNQEVLRRMRHCRIAGERDAALNFVPVDHVVADMLALSARPDAGGAVWHSTSGADLNVERTIEIIGKLLGLDSLAFTDQPFEPAGVEELFHFRSSFYGGYFRTRKTFARSLPPHPALSWADFQTYIATFIAELDQRRDGLVFDRAQVTAPDGAELVAYTLGDRARPPLVLVNAYGMPAEFMGPLAARLSDRFFVVTWESRWVPAVDHPFDPERCESDVHARDLIAILDALAIPRAPLAGWSSGAQVALRAMVEAPARVSCAVLLNNAVAGAAAEQPRITPFEKNVRTLLARIATDLRYARKYCDLIYGQGNSTGSGDRQLVSSVLTSTDPFLVHMTSVPYRSPERLHRYAIMMNRLFDEARHELPARVEHPVLVCSGENDLIASPSVSTSVVRRLRRGELHVDPGGDHFSHYYEPAVAERVASFVLRHP